MNFKTCEVILNFNKNIFFRFNSNFVPKHSPVQLSDANTLDCFIKEHKNILVLTGAGISTESGIPDYRSAGVGLYARSKNRPIIYQQFIKNPEVRVRYWARNYVGWPRFSSMLPNFAHKFLKQLEDKKKIVHIITQNVDNLHSKAGSKKVLELHGTAYVVHCLSCDYTIDRHKFQNVLSSLNPQVPITELNSVRPDGDVELSQDQIDGFKLPKCPKCKGDLLIPRIVFFGDNIPKQRVQKVNNFVEDCDSLLVLGSSLFVYSGYRIVLEAKSANKPVVLVNIGPTRADDCVDIKIEARFGEILPLINL